MPGNRSELGTNNPSPNLNYSPNRGKHVSNLTINVQSTMGWKPQAQALQERTNSVDVGPAFTIVSPSFLFSTPDTSYTFGVPNPTNYTNSPNTSASSYDSPHASPQPLSPPPRTRSILQPYTVPSTFNHPRSQKTQPRTSVSSRAMSRSFSLTPTVASSVSQSTISPRIPSNSQTKASFRHPSTSTTACAQESPLKSGFTVWRGDTMTRRQRRYTVAESSLSSSLSNLVPLQDRLASPSHVRQREKDGLEKAMAAVDERIREERETLERLTSSMKEGNEAEGEYRERRKGRWRVEKSLEALGDERKVLEERRKALTTNPGCDGGTSTRDAELSRIDRNLQLFLSGACSPTRAGFRHVSRRPSGRHRNHLSVPNMRTRRMTVTGVQPMKLRRLSAEDTFAEVLKSYARSNSKSVNLETGQAPSPMTPDDSRSIIRQSLPQSIASKAPSLTSVMEDEELVDRKPDPDSSHDLDFDDSPISPDTGTALIFRHHLSSRDVDDDDVEFELPAYAKDLVTKFDRDHGTVDVGLAIQSRETPLPPPTLPSPFRTPRKHSDLPTSPSPSKQLGHGLFMPRPSLVVPDGEGSPSRSRPVSLVDSMSSRTPEGSSHDLRVVDRDAAASPSPTLGNRLRRKLSKRIFKKW
ncbi:hypothetical protein PQX77_009552 [Marasmius sp. AFHP31]|nr:hypothetical protein PQX77_009552 [Marasmius sp. AFHP31]